MPKYMNPSELDFIRDKTKSDFEILKKWIPARNLSGTEIEDNILILLSHHIRKLLETNMPRLLEILYQTDISEEKVRNAFHADKSGEDVSRKIAELYLQRLRQKWITRNKYNQDISGDWD